MLTTSLLVRYMCVCVSGYSYTTSSHSHSAGRGQVTQLLCSQVAGGTRRLESLGTSRHFKRSEQKSKVTKDNLLVEKELLHKRLGTQVLGLLKFTTKKQANLNYN